MIWPIKSLQLLPAAAAAAWEQNFTLPPFPMLIYGLERKRRALKAFALRRQNLKHLPEGIQSF
jgi:hypothetical protein